jgi:hypothetical protein
MLFSLSKDLIYLLVKLDVMFVVEVRVQVPDLILCEVEVFF